MRGPRLLDGGTGVWSLGQGCNEADDLQLLVSFLLALHLVGDGLPLRVAFHAPMALQSCAREWLVCVATVAPTRGWGVGVAARPWQGKALVLWGLRNALQVSSWLTLAANSLLPSGYV